MSPERDDALHWRLWRRLPLAVRAVAGSLAAAVGGIQVWRYLVGANVAVSPRLPWAVPAMALYLFVYWKYLEGRGWPRSTSAVRQANLRARALGPSEWRWSLFA